MYFFWLIRGGNFDLMEVEMEKPAMTYDEVSMERSKSFVKALQVF